MWKHGFHQYGPEDVLELAQLYVQVPLDTFYRGLACAGGEEEQAVE